MRHHVIVAFACLATVAMSAATAQTTANGSYYATPSWDQTLPTSTRFVVLANLNSDAVLDRETGLVWQRTLAASNSTQAGQDSICKLATTGNRLGWRLPSAAELSSLFDPSLAAAPHLPIGHPFINFPAAVAVLWTSSPDAYSPATSGTVAVLQDNDLIHPVFVIGQLKSASFRGLCVRGSNAGN